MKNCVPISEKAFSQQIIQLFKLYGWKYYCVFDQSRYARRSSKGFPDYLAIRGSRLLIVEIKSEDGRLTEAQADWLAALRDTGKCEVYLWRPSDFEKMVEVLAVEEA